MDNRELPTIDVQKMDPKLYTAAMEGDMEVLPSILEANEHPAPNLTHCLTPQKNTVLHIAVEFGQQTIVEKVIQLCPSLISQHNSKGDTPLHVAARAGHLDLTKLLTPALNLNLTEGNPTLEEGNSMRQVGGVALRMSNLEDSNPVHEALKKSHGEVALRMSNLEGSNPVHEALKKSHGEVALYLLAFEERHGLVHDVNMAGESLLYLAAEAGLDEVVKKIIEIGDYSIRGPDGQNPLHIAVIKGRLGVVKILLDKKRNFITQADRFGNTVLHYASARNYSRGREEARTKNGNQKQILELLLKANPSLAYAPNINGDYPLFFAIRKDFNQAIDTILDHCPDSAELVNQKGQNALHLAVMEKNWVCLYWLLTCRLEFKKLINEQDSNGNTPMHLATQTNQEELVTLLIYNGSPDLTLSNKQGLTAMDICGYTENEHPICDTLRKSGAVPGRHRWQDQLPPRNKTVKIRPEFKKLGLQTLPIATSLVATVTFAAAFTVPGGYKNDGPREGLPVFMRNAALQAFVLSDILAFCSSMAATVLLIYVNAYSEDAFKFHHALKTLYYISGVAIIATITAFLIAVYVLTSKESLSLAVTYMVLGSAVPLFLACYTWFLKKRKWNLYLEDDVEFLFAHQRENV